MDRILELLAKIGTLDDAQTVELKTLLTALGGHTPEQLATLDSALSKAFEQDSANVGDLRLLADGIKAVVAETDRRETVAAETKALRDEVAGVKTPKVEEPVVEAPAAEVTPEPTVVETAPVVEPVAEILEPVAAAAPAPSLSDVRPPATTAPRATDPASTQSIVTASGQAITSAAGLADAMTDAIVASANGGSGKIKVASVLSNVQDESRMSHGTGTSVTSKFQALTAAAQAPDAFTASGGVCAPLAPRYDLFNVSDAGRPVRDGLVQFDASRGGATYTTPAKLSDLASAVTVWTEANDRSPSSPTTKPRFHIACGAAVSVYTDAIPLRLAFGNMEARAYPEIVAQNTALGMAAQARVAELNLLAKIDSYSSARTGGAVLGATRDLLFQANQQAAAFRMRHRMAVDASLDILLPQWFLAAVRADLARQLPGDDTIAVTDAEILGYLAAAHLRPIWSMDSQFNDTKFLTGPAAGVTATATTGFPTTLVWRLFPTGTFIFLDGGKLDLGVIRDSTLNNTNDYEMFVETFENVAFVGVESVTFTSTIVPNGTSTGATAVASVTASSE